MFDAYLDVARLADGIDPERQRHVAADFVGKRAVKEREEGLRLRLRQIVGRQDLHGNADLVARHGDELFGVIADAEG